jgi:hypothetical protein
MVAAAEHREKSKQVEQESDHWAEIFSLPAADRSITWRRTEFWRRTGLGLARAPGIATTTVRTSGSSHRVEGERSGVEVMYWGVMPSGVLRHPLFLAWN